MKNNSLFKIIICVAIVITIILILNKEKLGKLSYNFFKKEEFSSNNTPSPTPSPASDTSSNNNDKNTSPSYNTELSIDDLKKIIRDTTIEVEVNKKLVEDSIKREKETEKKANEEKLKLDNIVKQIEENNKNKEILDNRLSNLLRDIEEVRKLIREGNENVARTQRIVEEDLQGQIDTTRENLLEVNENITRFQINKENIQNNYNNLYNSFIDAKEKRIELEKKLYMSKNKLYTSLNKMKKIEIKSLQDKKESIKISEDNRFKIDSKLANELDKIFNDIIPDINVTYKYQDNTIIIKDENNKLNKINETKMDELKRKIKTTHYLYNQNKFTETSNFDYNIEMDRYNVMLVDGNKFIISNVSPNIFKHESIFKY